MDKTLLVTIDLSKGLKIVKALEHGGLSIAVALWLHSPDYDDWRFVLASSHLDSLPRLKAYKKVNDVLRAQGMDATQKPPC
jgi:hypothetical protein